MLSKNEYDFLKPLYTLYMEKEGEKRSRDIFKHESDFRLAETLSTRYGKGYVTLGLYTGDDTKNALEITVDGLKAVQEYEIDEQYEKDLFIRWKKGHKLNVISVIIAGAAFILSVIALAFALI
jgi:hypothetical protein